MHIDECVGENASSVGDGVVDAAALAMENQSAAATAATQRLVAVVGTSSTGITAVSDSGTSEIVTMGDGLCYKGHSTMGFGSTMSLLVTL